MSAPRALPIYVADDHVLDLAPIKAAKAALDLPYKVVPVDPADAPGSRVLAVGAKPGWMCDFYLIAPQEAGERVQEALLWVLSDAHDPEATTVADTMLTIFGEGTREITAEELASERAWADYFAGF